MLAQIYVYIIMKKMKKMHCSLLCSPMTALALLCLYVSSDAPASLREEAKPLCPVFARIGHWA